MRRAEKALSPIAQPDQSRSSKCVNPNPRRRAAGAVLVGAQSSWIKARRGDPQQAHLGDNTVLGRCVIVKTVAPGHIGQNHRRVGLRQKWSRLIVLQNVFRNTDKKKAAVE